MRENIHVFIKNRDTVNLALGSRKSQRQKKPKKRKRILAVQQHKEFANKLIVITNLEIIN